MMGLLAIVVNEGCACEDKKCSSVRHRGRGKRFGRGDGSNNAEMSGRSGRGRQWWIQDLQKGGGIK